MIPKIIHACWFGTNEIPQEYKIYIETWKKHNPDFQVKIWTLESFNSYFDKSAFVCNCLELKNYAFLSDYFRLVVLYEFGGIYMDTDVECFKRLDLFLKYDFFIGYIFDCSLGTAVIGSKPKNKLLLKMKKGMEYDFEREKKFTVNNDSMTKFFLDNFPEFKLNGEKSVLNNNWAIFPKETFERLNISNNEFGGYCCHHCDGTWRKNGFCRRVIKPIIKFFLGKKGYEKFTLKRLTPKQKYYLIYKNNK